MSSSCATRKVGDAGSVLDSYILWQKQHNLPLFQAAGTWWRLYRDSLVSASAKPEPAQVETRDAQSLLYDSKAYLLRYFTKTSNTPTQFWYVMCDEYNFEKLPGKMRTKIRRAYKDCTVRPVDASWVAEHGYICYKAAYSRYENSKPISEQAFREECIRCINGPFEFWGAFAGDVLAAFAKCVVGADYITMVVFKIHPKYTSSRPSYALQDTLLQTYVANRGKPVNNGYRSLDHDTNMQDFLLQFGFRRVYTDLQVVYRPPLHSFVAALYPLKSWIDRLSFTGRLGSLKTLLRQEEIRRSFAQAAL